MKQFWSTLPDAQVTDSYTHSERPIKAVRKIIIRGAVSVYFRRHSTPQLVVSGQTQDAVDTVKTNLVGDRLIIENKSLNLQSSSVSSGIFGRMFGGIFGRNISASGNSIVINGNNNIVINGNNIYTGDISGGSQGHVVVGITLPEIATVSIEGSGTVTLFDLKQAGIEFEIAGSGDIFASGEVDLLTVNIAGSGEVNALDLIANQGKLSIAGSGDISAHVKKSVTTNIAGSGDIVIRGHPFNHKNNIAGSGGVKFE